MIIARAGNGTDARIARVEGGVGYRVALSHEAASQLLTYQDTKIPFVTEGVVGLQKNISLSIRR